MSVSIAILEIKDTPEVRGTALAPYVGQEVVFIQTANNNVMIRDGQMQRNVPYDFEDQGLFEIIDDNYIN